MSYVFDSSSLIYLGKIKILDKIKFLEGKKFIPKNVYEEVINRGIEKEEPEAIYIKELIEDNIFIVKETKIGFDNIEHLSYADKEVLSLANETESTAIIDEIYARNIANNYKIKNHGTIFVLLSLLKKKIITKIETKKYLDNIIKFGFYVSAELYGETLKLIDKM